MTQKPLMIVTDDRRGFIKFSHLVLVIIFLAVYSGYKFLPVYLTNSQIQAAVDKSLGGDFRNESDETIKGKVVSIASSVSVPLDQANISIKREKLPGQRTIKVDFEYPYAISFLGFQKTLRRSVQVAKAVKVDEAAEARREERLRQEAEEASKRAEEARVIAEENAKSKEECEKQLALARKRSNSFFIGKCVEVPKFGKK